ncbi:PD-(D/E)XK nuclease family protein [Gilvimarinus agarilyticus]|uniref:PD-(D/E)XK nuclease family protein n=1 Tax=Gilvimarinus sp. 2_MG-2023 TaxID=3062666 RepID=UPI001C08F613|nr:PD-(D/E)XK nuclease family protein [Gilvimarinus sp. 2_MG-2023]MBU2887161.1 PD-(D/E)XK nuclease family protein [Gilvimarinus agarilyticus]MDO6571820.1 PD-(D/E)XK nuclease family protein [Gilvimarinus sp. 2_MG-2023]
MSAILMDISAFEPALRAGKLIVTANNRQKNQILRAFNNLQNNHSWVAPRVLTLSQWQQQLWARYQLSGLPDNDLSLIGAHQRDYLWRVVIEHYATAQQLLQSNRLISQAESARMALDAWLCPIQTLREAQQTNETSHPFDVWYLAYHKALADYRLSTEENIQHLLIHAINAGHLPFEEGALLYGFDDFTPLVTQFIQAALPNAETITSQTNPNQVHLQALTDTPDEILQAALWSNRILQRQPDAVIGVVIPNLGQIRHQVEGIFQSIFSPLQPMPTTPAEVAPYNFSAGTPLADTPIIDAALMLAQGLLKKHNLTSACDFIGNRYIGQYSIEWRTRQQAINQIRKKAAQQYSLGSIRQVFSDLPDIESDSEELYTLQRCLVKVASQSRNWNAQKKFHHWKQELLQLLNLFYWPGDRVLNSMEHQQVAMFYQVLEELDTLSLVHPICSFWDYLEALSNTLRRTPFQAQTPDSPIQILGTLEAAGLQFTDLWVMGMHNGAWPPAASPNPLLPVQLQRDWGMPKSSSERELNYAARLTQRLLHSAPQVVFSYPTISGDRHLQVSRIIEELCPAHSMNEVVLTEQSTQQKNYLTVSTLSKLEIVNCEYAPALPPGRLPGGTGILKMQATCPFSALAKFRLGARAFDEPILGLSALDRGNILHQILADFWQTVGNKAALIDMSEEKIQQLFASLIDPVLAKANNQLNQTLGPRFIAKEKIRLIKLLNKWIDEERQRPDFTVTAIEQLYAIDLSGYQLNVQVDRIDTLDGKGTLIIDYKTGATATKNWQAASFFDPQLPLYACEINPSEVQGISFATLNSHSTAFTGWGDNISIKGISEPESESWQAQLQVWREQLSGLLNEITTGYAPVDYRFEQSKRFEQDLISLNRINEHSELDRWSQNRP